MKNEDLLREYIRGSLQGERIDEFFGFSPSDIIKQLLTFHLVNKLTDHYDDKGDGFAYKWIDIITKKTGIKFSPYTQREVLKFVRNNQHQVLDLNNGNTILSAKILANMLNKRFLK